MAKKILIFVLALMVLVGACAMMRVTRIDKERVEDVEYKVLLEEEIPAEVFEEIEGFKHESKQCSYICSDRLYIVVSYGRQEAGGYSVEVNDLYESSNTIFVKTTLMGPKSKKDAKEDESYPYVVLKLSLSDKKVVFI